MMQHFCSISKNPGKTGEYFYSSFFRHYAVTADYRALGVQDLVPWIDSGEWEKYEGISVSMPFKSQIVEYLDSMDDIVKDFGSSNTVKVNGKFWSGFNTDIYGIFAMCETIPNGASIQILGDGAMSQGFQIVLSQSERNFSVFSRKRGNWEQRHTPFDCKINTTSFGTHSLDSPFIGAIESSLVIDLSIAVGKLSSQCKEAGIKYIGGMNFYEKVFAKQFCIYTGIEVESDLFSYFLSRK